jgi:hypothetical protein
MRPPEVDSCYPGDAPEITREDADEAMRLADKVKEAIFLSLKGET